MGDEALKLLSLLMGNELGVSDWTSSFTLFGFRTQNESLSAPPFRPFGTRDMIDEEAMRPTEHMYPMVCAAFHWSWSLIRVGSISHLFTADGLQKRESRGEGG